MAVSGNSTVDLLVLSFSPNERHFMLRSLRADLVIVQKVIKNGSQLLVVYCILSEIFG